MTGKKKMLENNDDRFQVASENRNFTNFKSSFHFHPNCHKQTYINVKTNTRTPLQSPGSKWCNDDAQCCHATVQAFFAAPWRPTWCHGRNALREQLTATPDMSTASCRSMHSAEWDSNSERAKRWSRWIKHSQIEVYKLAKDNTKIVHASDDSAHAFISFLK